MFPHEIANQMASRWSDLDNISFESRDDGEYIVLEKKLLDGTIDIVRSSLETQRTRLQNPDFTEDIASLDDALDQLPSR